MAFPHLLEKKMNSALHQFIFPFSINRNSQRKFNMQLQQYGFIPFSLGDIQQENLFYGPNNRVSHREMERYYQLITRSVLFPHEEDAEDAFQRYSKKIELDCALHNEHTIIPFTIHSVDVVLCPFYLGFITIRTELNGKTLNYSLALEFANRFRVLQNITEQDDRSFVHHNHLNYNEVEDFIFEILVPNTLEFLDKDSLKESYFGKLPFFVDERMYVECFYSMKEGTEITLVDLYRASRMDGFDEEGNPFIGAANMDYIQKYCTMHAYNRWGPNTYFITDENAFCCITNQPHPISVKIANKMYGEYYYALLINLFHKIVLLKFSNQYSHVQLELNQDKIEELIRSITTFSAKYYFIEVVSQSQGKEIFIQLRKLYGNDELFVQVKQTLDDLFKYQSNYTNKRSSYLLRILTIYTVISGIFGMNQVIENLKGPIDWSKMRQYSPFEYLALVVTISGIIVSLGLAVNTVWQLIKKRRH